MAIPEISPEELKARLDAGEHPVLVDVREAFELQICKLKYDLHIPLGDLEARMSEIDPNAQIVVYCRSGGRSGKAVEFLMNHGYGDVTNLRGGILAWGEALDPSMPAY